MSLNNILANYHLFKEPLLTDRFFKHKDICKLIDKLSANELFTVTQAGVSFEGREIYLIKVGYGQEKVMLWSQMHGDEPTATMALFDLFNFLTQPAFEDAARKILANCTLYIIPMLNPDGAEAYTRRNAQYIDINRDFNQSQSPEGKLLKQLRDEIKPHFGFNLHDQSVRWSAGNTGNPASISLLAPPFDASRSIDATRLKAIQIVSGIYDAVSEGLPGFIGRFSDEYEPRAFGDNFQSLGTSTILIEAGGYPGDREKQVIRKHYFAAILSGLSQIADHSYRANSADEYFCIPENCKNHFALLIKNCRRTIAGKTFAQDFGLIAEEEFEEGSTRPGLRYYLEEAGDLSGYYGYEVLDREDLELYTAAPLKLGSPAHFVICKGSERILSFSNGRIDIKKL